MSVSFYEVFMKSLKYMLKHGCPPFDRGWGMEDIGVEKQGSVIL